MIDLITQTDRAAVIAASTHLPFGQLFDAFADLDAFSDDLGKPPELSTWLTVGAPDRAAFIQRIDRLTARLGALRELACEQQNESEIQQ